jgi:hypothetical protein
MQHVFVYHVLGGFLARFPNKTPDVPSRIRTAIDCIRKRLGGNMFIVPWLIAALIFFSFSFVFWHFGNDPIRSYTDRKLPEAKESDVEAFEDDPVTSEFLREFDGYLESINKRNRFRYRIAAGGFIIAGLTALLLALV